MDNICKCGFTRFEFNLNGHVLFKPTKRGLLLFKQDHHGHELKTDDEGYAELQLHEFMRIFGPHLTVGFDLPCETGVVFWDKTQEQLNIVRGNDAPIQPDDKISIKLACYECELAECAYGGHLSGRCPENRQLRGIKSADDEMTKGLDVQQHLRPSDYAHQCPRCKLLSINNVAGRLQDIIDKQTEQLKAKDEALRAIMNNEAKIRKMFASVTDGEIRKRWQERTSKSYRIAEQALKGGE